MLAYDFPLLSLTLLILVIGLVFYYVFALIWAFIDNFRRRDHSGWAKAGWFITLLVIPVFGLLFYIGTRPADAAVA
jgi:hypothetical protein